MMGLISGVFASHGEHSGSCSAPQAFRELCEAVDWSRRAQLKGLAKMSQM